MRISAKGRYALAAMVDLALRADGGVSTTVISISKKLGISKIYLEQVFSLLKRGGLVTSIKGAQGGYLLDRPAEEITVLDILQSVELSLFESAEDTVREQAPEVDGVLHSEVFDVLDTALRDAMRGVTLADLCRKVQSQKQGLMFYI